LISQSNWHHKRKITEKYQSARIMISKKKTKQKAKEK
jgi:hypothetical protein